MLRTPLFWQLAGVQVGLVLLTVLLQHLAGPVVGTALAIALLGAALLHARWLSRRAQTLADAAEALAAQKAVPPVPDDGPRELAQLAESLRQLTAEAAKHRATPDTPTHRNEGGKLRADHLALLSHEMRTPLNGIMGMTQLALQTALSPEQREYLDIVRTSSDFLLGVINDLADPRKLESGAYELQTTRFALRETVREVLKLVALRAYQKGVEVFGDVAAEVPDAIEGDPHRLRQLLVNLLGNAIHFTHRGCIEVHVAVADDTVKDKPAVTLPAGRLVTLSFSVVDTGVGIAPERQARLFDSWRPTAGGALPAGQALGLVVARGLAERLGGRIWVESTPEVGSTFHFTAQFALPADGSARWQLPVPPGLAGRVVLVAVGAGLRKMLTRWLEGWGARPVVVDDPAAAPQVSAEVPALALVDATLPGTDGFAYVTALRQHDALRNVRVVMLVGPHQPGEAARCRELGLPDPLIKPLGAAELLAALTQALGLSRGLAPGNAPRLAPPTNRLRVILAEGNPLQRQLAVVLLEKLGHDVTLATTGSEVLAVLAARPADVVLLDPLLADPDGCTTARAIREREASTGSRVPIVALIGYGRTDERDRCKAAGMDVHVAKPMHVQELVRAIESVTGPPESRR